MTGRISSGVSGTWLQTALKAARLAGAEASAKASTFVEVGIKMHQSDIDQLQRVPGGLAERCMKCGMRARVLL